MPTRESETLVMDARKAVNLAKAYVLELFKDEGAKDIGLEELVYNDGSNASWDVTVGFRRVWKITPDPAAGIAALLSGRTSPRVYKIVRIDKNGKILALKHREVAYGEPNS